MRSTTNESTTIATSLRFLDDGDGSGGGEPAKSTSILECMSIITLALSVTTFW